MYHKDAVSFTDAYIWLMKRILKSGTDVNCRLGGMKEVRGASYTLQYCSHLAHAQPDRKLTKRNFKYDFAIKHFEWLMAGKTDMSELLGTNANAANFMPGDEIPEGFTTAYGPRITRQLPGIIKLLTDEPNTRRAVMHILEEKDKLIWDLDTKLEYPCTSHLHFFVRGDFLHTIVVMRSNNVTTTMCYDVSAFWLLSNYLCYVLQLRNGNFTMQLGSAHILDSERELASAIIEQAKTLQLC